MLFIYRFRCPYLFEYPLSCAVSAQSRSWEIRETLIEIFGSCSSYNSWMYTSVRTYTRRVSDTCTHTRRVSDNRMVSRCYRGKTRCTEFTRYPTVVKMLKQQLSAPRSFLASDVGMYVRTYVPNGVRVYNRAWKIWIILSCDSPPKNMDRTIRTTTQDCEKWRATLQLLLFREIEIRSRFDTSNTIFTVSPEMIRVEISRNVESEIKYRYIYLWATTFSAVYIK